jgi:hypothetical protein
MGHLFPSVIIPGIHFYLRLNRQQGHNAAGRIMSMKNTNDIIGNRTRNLPVCNAAPQPTAPRVPKPWYLFTKIHDVISQKTFNLIAEEPV